MIVKILAIVLLTYSRIKYRLMITSISYSLLLSKSLIPIILICPYNILRINQVRLPHCHLLPMVYSRWHDFRPPRRTYP